MSLEYIPVRAAELEIRHNFTGICPTIPETWSRGIGVKSARSRADPNATDGSSHGGGAAIFSELLTRRAQYISPQTVLGRRSYGQPD